MMVNSIKHNFLIIGLTGPLRSGCTTAAMFFADKPQDAIAKYVSSSEQIPIETLYKEISHLLKEKSSVKNRLIEKKMSELKELLRKRELKKVLTSYTCPTFQYISMSKMLLKYCVEYVLNKDIDQIDPKYEEIVNSIKEEHFNKEQIKAINFKIESKKYQDISNDECEFYDRYLKKLDDLILKLKKGKSTDIIGDILQDFGDNTRKHGNPFKKEGKINNDSIYLIAEQANRIVKFFRNRHDDEGRKRHHFVIECFRNPYEVEYFRYRYYEFYLFSLLAGIQARQVRGTFSKKRDIRDSGEKNQLYEVYKQNVSRCVYFSDIAINNESTQEEFYEKLIKYYALIVNPGCITPTFYELLMNQADSLSLRSSCISRQVGAIIIGKNGYVVGAGWNDTGEGQIGCGYRQLIDIKNLPDEIIPTNPLEDKEFRKKFILKGKNNEDAFCFKDEYSLYFLGEKFKKFRKERKDDFKKLGLTKKEQLKMIQDWLAEDIKIKRLEYCRALHAEENALLQTSKIGGMGVKDGRIFTTSFPCELCAKKIYQAGIKEIVYTEPYPESISKEVFLKDGIKKVKLTQFEGVKSHSYYRLFKSSMDKKEMQALVKFSEEPYQE